MELNIRKWEYKKVLNDTFKVNLPETQFCYHCWNGRVRTLVMPEWTSWLKEKGENEILLGYKIVKVSVEDEKIETGYLYVSNIEDYLNKDSKNLTMGEKIVYDVAQYIAYYFGSDSIKYEYFYEGYQKVINKLTDLLTTLNS